MKRILEFIICAIVITGVISVAYADEFKITQPDAVGGGFVGTRQDQGQVGTSGLGPGIELFLKYNLSPNVFLTMGTGISGVYDKILTSDVWKTTLFPLAELKLGYNLGKGPKFMPYIYGGLTGYRWKFTLNGYPSSDAFYDGAFLLGAGFEYPVNPNWNFHLNGDYRYQFTSSNDPKPQYWVGKLGLTYNLKQGEESYGEPIEYPLGDEDVAYLDDLFNLDNDNQQAQSGNSEEDALALLFQPEAAESGTTEMNYPDTEVGRLMAKIQKLKNEMDDRLKTIETLENQVAANEKAIAAMSGGAAGAFGVSNASEFTRNYEAALQKYYARKYNDAIQTFRSLLASDPDNRLASNCQYWIGESYYQMGRYQEAIGSFMTVLGYKKSYKLDDALIMSGLTYMKMGDNNTAREQFESLVSRYPQSEYVNKAMKYLRRL